MGSDANGIMKRPAVVLAGLILICQVVALWGARAPTSFTGKIPGLDKLPIELNIVYVIVFGPIATCVLVAGLWILIVDRQAAGGDPVLLYDRRIERILLSIEFVMIFALSIALSIQYFLVLAPQDLCSTRPHFDFLWRNISGPIQISHCMSGTAQVNARAPYYFEPQIAQSWGHVLWPLVTLFCLAGAWRSWGKAGQFGANTGGAEQTGQSRSTT